ncbi:MAG: hypothetical protein ACREH8_21645, partial [Opitutaceae bacterium]
ASDRCYAATLRRKIRKTMKRSTPLALMLCGSLALVAVTTQAANAEDARTAVAAVPQTQSAVQRTPQPAVSQPSRPGGEASATVELSVFEVRADPTDSYEALNTTSITDPAGINWLVTPNGQFAFAFDRKSRGAELTLTAKPAATLRLRRLCACASAIRAWMERTATMCAFPFAITTSSMRIPPGR